MRIFRAFWESRRGATSIEYAMVAGCISIVIVVALTSIGVKLNSHYIGPVANGLS